MRKYILFLVLFLTLTCSVFSKEYTEIIAFGDSLIDMGNRFTERGRYLEGLPLNSKRNPEEDLPYYEGRYSNGPVWVEYLAEAYGLKLTPRIFNGKNYAYGGAMSGNGYQKGKHSFIPNLGQQINDYLKKYKQFSGHELIIISAGGNNLLDGLESAGNISQDIEDHIRTLHTAGGRHFLVSNLLPAGHTPMAHLGNEILNSLITGFFHLLDQDIPKKSLQFNEGMNAGVIILNTELAVRLALLEYELNIHIHHLDLFSIIHRLSTNPHLADIRHTKNNAFCVFTHLLEDDAEDHLFFDNIHPSSKTHRYIGMQAVELLTQNLD